MKYIDSSNKSHEKKSLSHHPRFYSTDDNIKVPKNQFFIMGLNVENDIFQVLLKFNYEGLVTVSRDCTRLLVP